jgi:hypothetical protein
MDRWARIFAVVFVLSSTLLVGCATTKTEEDPERVSSLPWNTPEKWEHSAPMGGAARY